MRDPFERPDNPLRSGDPDLLGRHAGSLPSWSEFGSRVLWTVVGLVVLLVLIGVVASLT